MYINKLFSLRLFLIILLGILPLEGIAKPFRIGVYANSTIPEALLKVVSGTYDVFSDNKKAFSVNDNALLYLNIRASQIVVSIDGSEVGRYNDLKFVSANPENSLRIKPIQTGLLERIFEDNMEIRISPKGLFFINEVNLESYVAGVLEGEIGMNQSKEFLKLQAIICRTYAISNIARHQQQGFDLCDQVHCQVYYGKARLNLLIGLAVKETEGKILLDSRKRPIVAAFHSNCGGMTYNSEDIWPTQVPYLRSVVDTFCKTSPHARWQQKIQKDKWTKYLEKYDSTGSLRHDSLNFTYNPVSKNSFYNYKTIKLPVKKVRNDWNFRSPSFIIEDRKDTLLFYGKGFGHGIGMCQEGAMRMAELGYSYQDIVKYYYQDVFVSDLAEVQVY